MSIFGGLGDMLGGLVEQYGGPQALAHALPGLVDKISPNGTAQPHLLDGSPADPAS